MYPDINIWSWRAISLLSQSPFPIMRRRGHRRPVGGAYPGGWLEDEGEVGARSLKVQRGEGQRLM